MLLTDVEGSTRLLVRHGQAGVAALGRIAELVSSAADAHGGEVSRLQGEGDSAVVLFGSAALAVAAALDVNRWMAAEPWPGGQTVAMRSGVHVGEVTASDDGVVGLEVHRCARVRALAGGGEVFLSDAALRDVGGHLPSSATVEDVGVVLLRGFVQPERVWRLVHPVLRRRHGEIAGSGVLPGAFPAWRTSLVGRDDDSCRGRRSSPGRRRDHAGRPGRGRQDPSRVSGRRAPVGRGVLRRPDCCDERGRRRCGRRCGAQRGRVRRATNGD